MNGGVKVVSFGGIVGFYARKYFPRACSTVYLAYLRLSTKREKKIYINRIMDNRRFPLVHVNLETVNKCNGSCSFCPNNKFTDKRKAKRMDEDVFKKIISDLKKINFSGVLSMQGNGEPFLDKDMPDRIIYAREMLPNAEIIIFTNGSLLTEDILKKIAGKLDKLYINNYNTKYELNNKSKMVINYVNGNEELFKNTEIIIEYRYINEILTTRGGYSPNKINHKKQLRSLCILPYIETFIFSDGSVGLCCCDVNKHFSFGNVREQDILDIFNSDKLNEIREKISSGRNELDFCKYCDFESKGGRRLKWIGRDEKN